MADTTTSNLSGLYKEVYAGKLEKLVPESSYLKQVVEFSDSEKVGNEYHQPVLLSYPHGFSFNASTGSSAFTLNAAVPMGTQDAKLAGSEIVLRDSMAYGAAFKAVAGGPKAFKAATRLQVEAMMDSMSKQLELNFLYGRDGLGQVTANAAGVLTISVGTWSAGTWAGMEGAVLEAFDALTDTANQHNTDLTVSAVNLDDATRTVTVTGTSAAVAANDHLFFKGARTTTAHRQIFGLNRIITASTGSMFNIPVTYNLWRGTEKTLVTQPTMNKLLSIISVLASRGMKGKLTALCPTKYFEVLNSDLSALRKFDSSYSKSKAENGFESIKFFGQTGEVEIVPHLYLKDGDCFVAPLKKLKRVGSTDITFSRPGAGGDEIYRELADSAGFEIRCYSDQAIFAEMPAHFGKQSGLTYA